MLNQTQPTQRLRKSEMKSTLTIKDLSLDKELSDKAMCAVRGGINNQANATQQSNTMALFAPVSVGNGSIFGGPAIIQVDSNPTQSASNYSSSSNESFKGFGWAY
jgi:hypothetical protein